MDDTPTQQLWMKYGTQSFTPEEQNTEQLQ